MTEPSPDFRHIDTWIFDLDNTLYAADSEIFAQIDARMGEYIARTMELPAGEARRLQKTYYESYGSSLSGLIAIHGVDPEAFLRYVHDIDLSALVPDEKLNLAIKALPGRHFVFTNGCRHHAGRVLERIGLAKAFDGIWDIRTLGFAPKPQPLAYQRIVAAAGFDTHRAAMFEDMATNLMQAHAMGMTTVWINNGSPWSHQGPQYPLAGRGHIHHEIDDLAEFLHAIRL